MEQKQTTLAGIQPQTPQSADDAYINGASIAAFFGTPIFALGNRLYGYFVLSLIPLVNIYPWLKLTFHGRRMSWAKGWESMDAFKKRQKVVGWIVGIFFIMYILFAILSASLSN